MSRLALVTGGAGFIGSHLAGGLLDQGLRVRVLDDLSSGQMENLAGLLGRIEMVRGDCCDPRVVRAALEGVDLVYHQAALPSVQRSVEEPLRAHRINLDASLILLEEARRCGVERLVCAGSSSVYGDSEELPKRESMRPCPLSPYAVQKLSSEAYFQVFCECYGLHTVVLRYFNVYGPRQDPSSPYSGVISLFITALLAHRAPKIYGDGEQTRDFVFVEDVVRANLRAGLSDVRPGSVVNISGGRRISINELYCSIREAVGGAALGLEPEYEAARSGDVRDSLADLTEARNLLGFEPEVELQQGVKQTVDYYRTRAVRKEQEK
ncbi:MAG: SDR family oxidoreductase [Planctomycetota bacterium]